MALSACNFVITLRDNGVRWDNNTKKKIMNEVYWSYLEPHHQPWTKTEFEQFQVTMQKINNPETSAPNQQ